MNGVDIDLTKLDKTSKENDKGWNLDKQYVCLENKVK